MAVPQYVFAELVRESCTATGTGAMVLSGALPGHRGFAGVVPVGAAFCYTIAGVTDPAQWECGVGQVDAQGRLVRTSVSASSSGGALVDFAAGLKTVALTLGAGWLQAASVPPTLAEVSGLSVALDGKLSLSATSALGRSVVAAGSSAELRGLAGLGNLAVQDAAAVAISGGSIAGVTLSGVTLGAAAGSAAVPSISFAGDSNSGLYNPAADTVALGSGGAERLRVTAAGMIGIGTTAPTAMLTVNGSTILGHVPTSGFGTVDVGDTLTLLKPNSAGVDGGQIYLGNSNFRSAGYWNSAPGIGALYSSTQGVAGDLGLYGYSQQVNARYLVAVASFSGPTLRPGADNLVDLGRPTQRWRLVYAGSGTINTSDERDKLWRGGMTAPERKAARAIVAELGFFQWRDAVADKGGEAARMHFGTRAQRVWGIMAEHGLVDPIGSDGMPGRTPYAFLCHDRWQGDVAEGGEAGHRFGLRLDQLALFLVAAMLPTPRQRRSAA